MGVVCSVDPSSSYYFRVRYNGTKFKELYWSDEHYNPEDERVRDLLELIRLINDIITSKPEYQRLPEPRAEYL